MLNEIYTLKKRILQLERLRFGLSFSNEQYQLFVSLQQEATTIDALMEQLLDFRKNFIEHFIPEEVMELWEQCDYEVYTDENHHRKFWNEIENDCSVSYFLDKYFELLGVSTSAENMQYSLSLYDFNNYDIFFDTKTDMVNFLEKYAVECYTAFEIKDGYWEELWSS